MKKKKTENNLTPSEQLLHKNTTKKIHCEFPGVTTYHDIGRIDILADSRVCSMRVMYASFQFQALKYCWQLFQGLNRKWHTRRQGDKDVMLTYESTQCPCLNCLYCFCKVFCLAVHQLANFPSWLFQELESQCYMVLVTAPKAKNWPSSLCSFAQGERCTRGHFFVQG